jgi:hypothetical protein
MADPKPDEPDQPAAAQGATPEDAAVRLNEILSAPIANPFAPEGKLLGPAEAEPGPQDAKAPTPKEEKPSGPSEAKLQGSPEEKLPAPQQAKAPVPPDFAAWEGAKAPLPEASAQASAAHLAPASAEESAPPAAEPAPAPAPPQSVSDSSAAGVIAKVRRLMLISTVLTALAIAAVFGVIGYRVFHSEGSPPTQATLTLPPGAKIVQTAIADDRIVLTLQVGGALEIRTYDLKTLKPLGRLSFSTVP